MKYRVVLVAAVVWFIVAGAQAAAPGLISYQTRLENNSVAITTPIQLQFRIFQGGSDTSGGTLAYHELVTVTPSAQGIVSHMIGSGTPQTDCPEVICQLSASDFPDGTTPVWIEVTVDPDGTPGNVDDDVLLPRTRFGTVGYAMHADELDGMDSSEFIDTSGSSQVKTGALTVAGTLVVGGLECPGCVESADLAPNSVTSSEIATGAVGTLEVQNNSLTANDLAPDSVDRTEIATGAVGTTQVENNSLTANDLAPDSVDFSEIATGAVRSDEIADSNVGTLEIADGAVTNDKINLTPTFSAVYSNVSSIPFSYNLGAHEFCALSQIQHLNMVNSGTNMWCRVHIVSNSWYLELRSNGTTTIKCQAVCF